MDAEEPAPPESLGAVAARLDHLIRGVEAHPNAAVRDQAMELRALVDALHRAGVRRLGEVLWLLCPWHNCVFDARTGKRLDGGAGRLDVIPVAIRDGAIQLALNVAPVALGR